MMRCEGQFRSEGQQFVRLVLVSGRIKAGEIRHLWLLLRLHGRFELALCQRPRTGRVETFEQRRRLILAYVGRPSCNELGFADAAVTVGIHRGEHAGELVIARLAARRWRWWLLARLHGACQLRFGERAGVVRIEAFEQLRCLVFADIGRASGDEFRLGDIAIAIGIHGADHIALLAALTAG